MTFMTWEQESLMKTLFNLGVCMGKTKAFALYADSKSFNLIQNELKVLDKLFWELDDELSDDGDLEVFDLPIYKEKAALVINKFNEIYSIEINEDQYNLVSSQLNPKFLIA